jgi:hypothetical protein
MVIYDMLGILFFFFLMFSVLFPTLKEVMKD